MKSFWGTIIKLLKSRKFVAALGTAVVTVGVLVAGWNEVVAMEVANQITEAVLVLAGLFIAGTAIEDAAQKISKP